MEGYRRRQEKVGEGKEKKKKARATYPCALLKWKVSPVEDKLRYTPLNRFHEVLSGFSPYARSGVHWLLHLQKFHEVWVLKFTRKKVLCYSV